MVKGQRGKLVPVEGCHLFRIGSIHALAKRLGWKLETLEEMANRADYRVYALKETGRIIQEPPGPLQALHRQIHGYVSRIITPDYLHSTVKGRSYVSNAREHIGASGMIKIDIKKFFPSVPQHRVMHFFRDVLQCAPDVAGLLANLICYGGRLATGSAASPIISYYAYKPMFDQIEAFARSKGLTMTGYVDDITLTGEKATRGTLHEVRKIIMRHGLKAHKAKFCPPGRPKLVTGVIVGPSSLQLPFSRWRAIKSNIAELDGAAEDSAKEAVLRRLISRLHEAAQIEPICKRMAVHYMAELRVLREREAANTGKFAGRAA